MPQLCNKWIRTARKAHAACYTQSKHAGKENRAIQSKRTNNFSSVVLPDNGAFKFCITTGLCREEIVNLNFKEIWSYLTWKSLSNMNKLNSWILYIIMTFKCRVLSPYKFIHHHKYTYNKWRVFLCNQQIWLGKF